ncbi:MAG: Ig-like domain repeat protein [Thermoanaerobaculia bacterium]
MQTLALRHALAGIAFLSALGTVLWASERSPGHLVSNSSTGFTGRTNLSGGAGCASCHGSSADSSTTVTIAGASTLYPGETGVFSVTTFRSGSQGVKVGIDVAASDPNTLAVQAGQPTILSGGEITHNGTLHTTNGGAAQYVFRYTMPTTAAISSTHTIAAVAAVGFVGWNHAPNFTVTTVAPWTPIEIAAAAIGSATVNLNWSGSTPEYRVIRKNGLGTTFTGPDDAASTLVFEGAGTAVTATGLTASTAYTFAVYGKSPGAAVYSEGNQTVSLTTTAAGGTGTIYHVNVGTGVDTNDGSPNAPFKTIKKAITVALAGDTVSVAAGTYNTASGETFPIPVTSGVRFIGSGAEGTIIDASGANARVMSCISGNADTLVSGFTIMGGLSITATPPDNSNGGGILSSDGDLTTITRNVIRNNEVRGYAGTGASMPSGGQAYGGGVYIVSSSPTVTNNVIHSNTARGGVGVTNNGSTTPGGSGGTGRGGGIYVTSGSPTLVNNTVASNSAIGGNGGASLGPGGFAGDGDSGGAFLGNHVNTIFAGNSALGGVGGNGDPIGANGSGSVGGLNNATATNSLFHGNSPTSGETIGSNAVLSDPQFVNAAAGNYRVAPTSPAKAAGTSAGAPSIDLDGVTRPNPPTIGAFEAIKAATTTVISSSPNPSTLDSSVTFTAAVTSGVAGTITGSVTFKDGGVTIGTGNLVSGSASFSTSSLTQGAHTMTAVYAGDSAFDTSTSSPVSHTVNPPPFGAPPNFAATATSASTVLVSWTPVAGATGYEIQRALTMGGGFAPLTTTSASSYNDSGLAGDTTFLYRVRAVGSSTSAFTSTDAATTSVFDDDPLVAGTTARGIHVTQLRMAVNAMRAAGGLGAQSFTDSITAGSTVIRAVHLTQLRTALDEARMAIYGSTLSYTDPEISSSTVLKAVHLNELRNGVR